MKKITLIIVIVFYNYLYAQVNLVPNPSFETYTTCPGNVSEMDKAIGWDTFGNSPDYFNTCASFNVGVPSNWVGYQYPSGGNAYAGVHISGNGDNYREYFGAKLTTTLIVGMKYFVSFKISRADNPNLFPVASNNQGAKLSKVKFSATSSLTTNNSSHINQTAIVTDSINWTSVFGSFVADSAYQYIALGNFYDDANTATTGSVTQYSYYYFDNICVSSDSVYAQNWVGVNKVSPHNIFKLYPNPVTDFLEVSSMDFNEKYSINIFDSYGNEIILKNDLYGKYKIDSELLPYGLLILKILYQNSVLIYKLVKNK